MHARTSLKAHRPVSGVARSTAAARCIVLLLHAIHSRVVAAAHTRSAALLRPWEDSSLGWWPRPRSGTERLGAPVGLLRACSTSTKCKYKVHSAKYKVQSAKYKVQSAKCKVQSAKCNVHIISPFPIPNLLSHISSPLSHKHYTFSLIPYFLSLI